MAAASCSTLWTETAFPTRTMLMVTHNIEEAVMLSDRILVLDNDPGRIKGEIRVPLDPPRDPGAAGFQALTDRAYRLLVEDGHRERDAA